MQRLKTHEFGLRATSRIKTFVLNIYSDNNAYANLFKTDFG